jgi:hypothetical protein
VELPADDRELALQTGPGQVVVGEADLPAGTVVTVRVQSVTGASLLAAGSATVDQDGVFRTTVDLSEHAPGTEAAVIVTRSGQQIASVETTVGACAAACQEPEIPPDVDFDDDPETFGLAAGVGRAVRGSSSLPAGTDVTIRLANVTGNRPQFSVTERATVGADGTFRAVFDLESIPAGSPVRATAVYEGEQLERIEGTVRACERGCRAPDEDDERGDRPGDLPTVEATAGGIATIPVTFGDQRTDIATVRIGGPAQTYSLVVTVADGNDDGRVTLLFDTGAVGPGSDPLWTVAEADGVLIRNRTRLATGESALDPGEYWLEQYDGRSRVQGNDHDRGTLVVVPPSPSGDGDPGLDSQDETDPEVVASFGLDDETDVSMGESTTMTLRTDETTVATLVIRDQEYTLVATVADGTGDERVPVRIHPGDAANESSPTVAAVDDGDRVEILRERGALRPARYSIVLAPGPPSQVRLERSDDGSAVYEFRRLGWLVVSEPLTSPTFPDDRTATSRWPALPVGGLAALVGGTLIGVIGVGLLLGLLER